MSPDYPVFHQNRANLIIHLVMVPIFVGTLVGTLWSAAQREWANALLLALGPAVSIGFQGVGHKREPNPPLPFKGLGDFVVRVLAEQLYRFPRFVITGGWASAWRRGAPAVASEP